VDTRQPQEKGFLPEAWGLWPPQLVPFVSLGTRIGGDGGAEDRKPGKMGGRFCGVFLPPLLAGQVDAVSLVVCVSGS
jgi:hypothetical protein